MIFLAGALISFSAGTSWGTFAILIPLGMPLAISLELPPSLLLSAILGGGGIAFILYVIVGAIVL